MDKKSIIVYRDDVGYEIGSDGFAHIVDYDTYETKTLLIPEFIYAYEDDDVSYPVISIKRKAFYNNVYIEGVIIPPSIKYIEAYAFQRSSIQKAIFLNRNEFQTITLEEGCFTECLRLVEVQLPDSLERIPDFTFHLCYNLKLVHTPRRLKSIGSMAFSECRSLEYFNFTPDIEEISDAAFLTSNLNYVEVGEKIKSIDSQAFAHIPDLKTVVILNPNAELQPNFINNDHQLIVYIKGQTHDKSIQTLKSILGQKNWYVVDPFEFMTFEGMKYLLFSKNVGRIVSYDEDEILSDIIIPEKIKGIPITDYQQRFLKGSQKIVSFQFPKTLKRLRGRAFDNCPNLKEVTFLNPVHEKEIKHAVRNEKVMIHAHNKKEIKEYAILIQKSYVSEYTQNEVTEYLIQIFESDSYQDAMLLGLDYVIENYSDDVEYLMIDDQPKKLMDLNNQPISEYGYPSLSDKCKALKHIIINSEEGSSYVAEVFGHNNSIEFKEFTIQHDQSLNNEEDNGSYYRFLKYLIEACHTLYEVRDSSREMVWSIDT
jgi:hypothetical protein